MPSNNKGVKLSLGEFMGGAPTRDIDALPTAPKVRGCVFESLNIFSVVGSVYYSRFLTMILSFSFRVC
jgi:hypothetical protein